MSFHVPDNYRFRDKTSPFSSDESFGNNGLFYVTSLSWKVVFMCIASDGMGWEHVSVSLAKRCPTWEEMCFIKSLFWDDEDVVVQFHPKKSEYVNVHNYCLHLWRPVDQNIPTPPKALVG